MTNEQNALNAELRVRGTEIGLPLVETLGAIRSHSASRITWHTHEPFELLFLTEGATAYEFRGGATLELLGGHFLIVPPRVRHRGLHDVRMPVSLCGVVFDPRRPQAGKNTPFSAADLRWLTQQFKQHALVVHAAGAELRRVVVALVRRLRAFAENRSNREAALALRLSAASLLFEAARRLTDSVQTQPQRTIEAAISYLQSHLTAPIEMTALAEAAGCSRARFFELFKQTTGMTPNDYLLRLRISRACELLADPLQTVTDVAYATGFSSSQYFSNVFRKYANVTPSEFRRTKRDQR